MTAENDTLGNFDTIYRTYVPTLPTRSNLARFVRARFALCAHENFRKKVCLN